MSDTIWLRVLRYLPKNLLSRGFGFLARRRRPRFVVRWVIRSFAARYGVDASEAARPIEAYDSLQEFFTRELAKDARPLESDPATLVSPVDGVAGAVGPIRNGRLVQAKGIDYSLEALLGDAALATSFFRGAFATLYLAPHDYHRIHAPVEGRIVRTIYEPGTLWPVNPPAVRTLPGLFAVNERVTTILDTHLGLVAVVMVGATNVGRISLRYTELVTNRPCRQRRSIVHEPPQPLDRGGELGVFELGSTVIVLVANPAVGLVVKSGDRVRVGRVIARAAGGAIDADGIPETNDAADLPEHPA